MSSACMSSHTTDRSLVSVERLYGSEALERLRRGHVLIVGLGGVGSWAAEALARTGVGRLTLVDLDVVAEGNLNRQVHATRETLGMNKVDAMAERVTAIAPSCCIERIDDFVTPDNVEAILNRGFDVVIDAVDQLGAKLALIGACQARGVELIVCGAAGGKRDPARLRDGDLAEATHDPLLARLRRRLRRSAATSGRGRVPAASGRLGVRAIWSDEPRSGARQTTQAGAPLACAGYGSVVTVTASMGFFAAARAIERLLGNKQRPLTR
ncbi:MAG: tRNA threonylcarbamoyladenosine dehydratase [Casimicrobiaceae bacterium]|nr:tRNA threonylcarbamoyladenosine dehydratase [Casimicrobiaceae bacterium]